MVITMSGKSARTARVIAMAGEDITASRSSYGDINWGKRISNAQLNRDISGVTNKRLMRQAFADKEVPMPKLLSFAEAREAVLEGRTVVGRPDRHMKGRGFWKINNLAKLHRSRLGTRKKRAATHWMEYIAAPREYRVHIFLGKSIRISEKQFGVFGETAQGDYVTVKPTHNVKHVRKAAKQAVAAVGLDFGAVDVLADDNNCWVLEVNSAPGLGGSLPRLYAETFNRWYREEQ